MAAGLTFRQVLVSLEPNKHPDSWFKVPSQATVLLYVFADGVPFEGRPGLSSNEIVMIFLSDAASAAIYGTRGASGLSLLPQRRVRKEK